MTELVEEQAALEISIESVSKSYDGKHALRETSLRVRANQCTVLIGPSGCGKSTILRLVVGLIAPDSGAIQIGSREMTPSSKRDLRLKMGYVIQEGGLFPHLAAAENTSIVAQDLGLPAQQIRARVQELAELTGISPDLLDRFPSQLSGGQRQRVGLMRALMLDPLILLMDEPLGALDPMIRSRLQTDLGRLFRQLKKTVLFVTHDMGEAAYLGDEIVLMREGMIVQKGSVEDLMKRPADPFVLEFLSAQRGFESATMNSGP